MPQAIAQHISPAKLAKLSALDTIDAYNARMKYATALLRFADACDLVGCDELTDAPPAEALAETEMRELSLWALSEIDQLVRHLFEVSRQNVTGAE